MRVAVQMEEGPVAQRALKTLTRMGRSVVVPADLGMCTRLAMEFVSLFESKQSSKSPPAQVPRLEWREIR